MTNITEFISAIAAFATAIAALGAWISSKKAEREVAELNTQMQILSTHIVQINTALQSSVYSTHIIHGAGGGHGGINGGGGGGGGGFGARGGDGGSIYAEGSIENSNENK